MQTARELNLTLQMCPKGRAKNDGNLERVGKELPRPSRRSHGGLKDLWRSLERPEDPVGPGAHTKPLALASWIYKDCHKSDLELRGNNMSKHNTFGVTAFVCTYQQSRQRSTDNTGPVAEFSRILTIFWAGRIGSQGWPNRLGESAE